MPLLQRIPQIGLLVRPRSKERLGIGKVVEIHGDEFVVEYFHSYARRERRTYPLQELYAASLARQTRCYVLDEDYQQWLAGRIGARDGGTYEVNLPDFRSLWVPEARVYVRSDVLADDPTETLILKSHETALFHERRFALVKALVRQRALTRGNTALSSARIELFAHQVEVVRRVLEDPVQRYLLADEVGLGKTIEAGVLIRQFLLDEALGHVLVLVPSLLVRQWHDELDARFDAFRSDRVHVVSIADVKRVSERIQFGMLVIDEAHHVAAGASSHEVHEREMYETCRRLAHVTKRLILISATPAANHEEQFLAMLHLLDPDTYHLNNVEPFRERVRMRQDIGRLLLTITEDARPFSLKLNLPKLAEFFPEDLRLGQLGQQVLGLLASNPTESAARAELIRAIRTHVSDTYRLHRRMLRNRRGALSDAILERANQKLDTHHDDSDDVFQVDDAFDEWRTVVTTAIRRAVEEQGEVALQADDYKELFLTTLQLANGSPLLLEGLIHWRLHGDADAARRLGADFPVDAVSRARALPLLAGEEDALSRLLQATREHSRADHRKSDLAALLRDIRAKAVREAPPRVIVFVNFKSTAEGLSNYLAGALGHRAIARHITGMTQEDIERESHRFRETYDCFVLICDRTAEEGLNFQFAEHLVHYDLPWHPNRLEQRIGRVDRLSRVRDLTMHVLLGRPADDSLQEAWFRLVNEGLGVFTTSIASLQFYIEQKLPQILDIAFRSGSQGVLKIIPEVRAEVQAEREQTEEQAAIDEIDASDATAVEFFQAMDSADARYVALQQAVEGWLCDTLQFDRVEAKPQSRIVKYVATERTLVPRDVLSRRFEPFLNKAGTFDRTVSARHPEVALRRLGDGLVDALAEFVAWDDRGQAFAIWRETPTWDAREGAEWVGFRFNVIVETDLRHVRAVLHDMTDSKVTPKALERRADAMFSPRTETIFLDVGLSEIADPVILDHLGQPFRKVPGPKGVDHNLTKHRAGALNEVVPEDEWERLCRDARDAALRLLRERPALRERCERFARSAGTKLGIKLEQLRLREAKGILGDGALAARERGREQILGESLIAGIQRPHLRVDSIGFIVISGRGPLPLSSHAPSQSLTDA